MKPASTRRALAVALSLAVLLPLSAARAAPPAGKAAPGGDEVEEVDDADVEVAPAGGPATTEGGAPRGGLLDVLGRLHVAVVHLPIGWVAMVVLLDLLAFGLRRRELEPAGLWALGATLLSFVPAIATGLLREDTVSQAPAVHALIETHETLVFVAAGLTAAAFAWRWACRRDLGGVRKGAYLALVAAAAALVVAAGHWGGKVAWGPEHLPF